MKKNSLLRFLLCCSVLFSLTTHAQQGTTCGNPISLDITPCIADKEMGTNETWFQFTAQTTVARITVTDPTDTAKAHIHRVVLYDACGGQQLTNEYVTSEADYILEMYCYLLIVGHEYYVKTEEEYGTPVCTRCIKPGASSFFNICVEHLVDGSIQTQSPCIEGCGNNLFANGDFELGNQGFFVDPIEIYHPCSQITAPFSYGICSNANQLNSPWQRPARNGIAYFVDDGPTPSNQPDVTLWQQSVNVIKNQTYCFTFWFTNIDANPGDQEPDIYVDFYGDATGLQHVTHTGGLDYNGTSGYVNGWYKVQFAWMAGSNTTLSINLRSFYNGNDISGNDVGMDDFVMDGPSGPPIITASPTTTVCAGQQVTLSANLGLGGSVVWQPGGYTTNPVIVTPTTTTTYTATVSDVCGTNTNAITINVNSTTPFFSFAPGNSACVGTLLAFTGNSGSNLQTTYSWNFGDNTSGAGSQATHSYSNPGTYTVTLTVTNSCGTFSVSRSVSIVPSSATYNPNCCSQNQTFTYDQYLSGAIIVGGPLNNPVHWTPANGTIYVRGTVSIFPGNALIIDPGTVVEFDPLSKIVVSRGAVLTVNGATLKGLSVCGTMWQGIEVWGVKNQPELAVQNPATGQLYQGKVILTNAIVRDAHTGVVAGRANTNYYDPNFGGGIILATGTSFINCGYSVRLTPYPLFVSHSRITSCVFNSTTLLDPGYNSSNSYTYSNPNNQLYALANPTQRAYTFVQTIGVKFTLIGDNFFNNSEYGIVGINSSLRVIDWDQNGTGNDFSNITNGEVHGNIFNSPFYANRIEKNTYNSTIIPIQSWNGIGDRITANVIPQALIGIGSVSSRAITINDNLIGNSNPNNGCLYGITATNTGAMGGLIGRNSSGNIFTQCAHGIGTGGNNSFLQIHCNIHDNLPNPVGSIDSWNNGSNSPLANQGAMPVNVSDNKAPAGNKFIPTTPITNEVYSGTNIFDYYRHNADQFGNQTIVTPTPTGVLTTSNVINTNVNEAPTSCDPGPPCTNCRSQMTAFDGEIDDLEAEKQGIVASIDGGQTQALLDAINSNMSGGQLKNLLLSNSPLSDQVLLAYIAKNGTPPGLFKDVITANSPVSSTVRSSLDQKIASMPNGIRNQILAAQSSSNRTLAIVDAELQSKIGQRQQVYNQQMARYVDRSEADTTVEDSVYLLLLRENTYAASATLASAYLANELYSEALITINSLDPITSEEHAEKNMLLLLYNIHSSGRDVFAMTVSEEQQVRNVAGMSVDCPARANARIVLFVVFGGPLEIDLNSNARMAQDSVVTTEDNYLGECYPNPATQQVNLECKIAKGSIGIINVFDVNGKMVYSSVVKDEANLITIEISGWTSGIYMCQLQSGLGIIGNQKIVVDNPE